MQGFCDKLRHKCFIDQGIILHDEYNLILQKTYEIQGVDFESLEQHQIEMVTKYLSMCFSDIPNGFVIYVNNVLFPNNYYLNTNKNFFQQKVFEIIDKERQFFFTKQAILFKNKIFITFVYDGKQDKLKKASNLLVKSNKKQEKISTLELVVLEFKELINSYIKLMSKVLYFKELNDEETISLLNYEVTGEWINYKLPKNTYIEIKYLLSGEFLSGLEGKINNNHIRVIAIDNYFPDQLSPMVLNKLTQLGFKIRWCTRFKFLDKTKSMKKISHKADLHEQNLTSIKNVTTDKITGSSVRYNRASASMLDEAEEALAQAQLSSINFGEYNCNVILYNEDENIIKEQVKEIINCLAEMGFKARDERLNFEEAYLGSIDGNVQYNCRTCLISTDNLADLLPISTSYSGEQYHPSNLYPEQSNSLFMVDCNDYSSFKGNVFVNDIGHSLIIGSTGSGKSTLVNFIIASHMRYENALFFGLDCKNSMMPLTYAANGEHYDLGIDEIAFQPLADLDSTNGFDFALDWIQTICEINNLEINTDLTQAINQALSSLSVMAIQFRTLENFYYHTKALHNELSEVIKLYLSKDTLQGKLFNANQNNIKYNNFNVFELSQLIHKGEKVLIPTLKYIFYQIMRKLDGRPTLIVIEEAWMAFNSPTFAKKLDEWLKTLRKLNVYIIMVTLQISDIINSPIKGTLMNQCSSIIYTPNKDIEKNEVYNWYKSFGLNDLQINQIKDATPKMQYYLTNINGNKLFNLDMDNFEIAKIFLSKTSQIDILKAKELRKINNNNFLEAWLNDNNFQDII